jgi:pyruvate dehydrogenase E1 component beta subunit
MKEVTFREAISEAMSEEMRKDPTVYLMGEEVAEYNGAYKSSQGMLEEFGPERVLDTPISELGFSGIGIGSAMKGCRPIIEFMTFNFSLIAIDQIINNAAKIYQMCGGLWNIPLVFRGPTASAGQLGATHSQSFENWYANCPGLKVIVPSNPYDAKGLLKAAIRDNDPVILMESEYMYSDTMLLPDEEYLVPIGLASVKKKGYDLTLVSFGKILKLAFKAIEKLSEDNVEVELIDIRSVRPLDFETILISVKKTNRLVVLEESWPLASISAEISYIVQQKALDSLDAPIKRITLPDVPAIYSSALMENWFPTLEEVVSTVKEVLKF